MHPNTPSGPRIVSSEIFVIPPDENTRRITEVLSTTSILDEEQAKLSLNPEAKKFNQALADLRMLLVGDNVANDFVQKLAREIFIARENVAHPDVFQRLHDALRDPRNFDVVYFTNWSDIKPSEKQKSFHIDGYKVGDLRIGLTNQVQSIFRVGPHIVDESGRNFKPLVEDGKAFPKKIQPEPGAIVLWDAANTLHRAPNIPAHQLEAIGGSRKFGTLSIGFNRVFERIQQSR